MTTAHFQPEALPHWDAGFLELAIVRPEYALAAHADDRVTRGGSTPARALQARCVRGAAAGLVLVPTSLQPGDLPSKKGLPAELAAAEVVAARAGLAADVGSFVMDAAKRRLSQLRMAVGFAARCHAVSEKGSRSDVSWMLTFTYRPGVDWRADHLSNAMQKCRHWCRKKGIPFRYVWVAEIQDGKRRADGIGRDVIHYHAVLWLPVGVKAPHFDKRGWWPYGMTRKDAPPVGVNNPVGYLLHYLKKDKDLSAMPKGARAYGIGGLDYSLRRARRWLRLPAFVQGNSSIYDDWKRAVGGGWFNPNGVRFASEFAAVIVGGVRSLVRVVTHARAISPSGPFSWVADRAVAVGRSS